MIASPPYHLQVKPLFIRNTCGAAAGCGARFRAIEFESAWVGEACGSHVSSGGGWSPPAAAGAAAADAPCCWICLGGGGDDKDSGAESDVLERPCACPRAVHGACLGRWQLHQAGRPEERACRFCGGDYGDWRPRLAAAAARKARAGTWGGPDGAGQCGGGGGGCPSAPAAPPPPLMAVQAGGRLHKLEARPGPAGKAAFAAELSALLGCSPSTDSFNIVFDVKVPFSAERVQLSGLAAYDAAARCAAVSAARRAARCAAPAAPPPPRAGCGTLAEALAAAAAHVDGAASGLVGSFDIWPAGARRPRRFGGGGAAAAPARRAAAGGVAWAAWLLPCFGARAH
ncbi:MAG: hypothetical protein J3K34DRAFT_526529 [Monoraphidium minutum]|nr:MAG: hypothetical protein J3K34DRAFT_526529 [Monoraphidium minutum]